RAVSHPSRPPCRALPQSYFPLSEPPTLRLRRRVLRPRRRPSGCPSHTTAASGCMTSTGESAKPRGSRVTMALQPAASAAAAQTASSKSRHPRVNARLITEWSTGATRNTVSRSPTTRRAEGAAKPGQDRRRLLARLRPRPREQVQVLLDQAGDRRSPPGGVALGLRHHFLVHAQGELAHIRIVSLSSYVFNSWARETSTTGGSRGDPLLHPPGYRRLT